MWKIFYEKYHMYSNNSTYYMQSTYHILHIVQRDLRLYLVAIEFRYYYDVRPNINMFHILYNFIIEIDRRYVIIIQFSKSTYHV